MILGLLLLAPVCAAQTASYSYFGTGCSVNLTWASPSQLTALGTPKLGSVITLQYSSGYPRNPRMNRVVTLLTGVSNSQALGRPLPLYVVGHPGSPCLLLCSPDIVQPLGGQNVTIGMGIPNNPSLLGLTLYQQFYALYRDNFGSWEQWYQFSNGGMMVIGT